MNFRHKLLIPIANVIIGLSGFYVAMYQISLLRIAQAYSLSEFMMGVIVAAQFAGVCVPPLFLGPLSERIGKRGVIIISLLLMVLGTFLVSAANSLGFFIAGIVLCGAGFSTAEGTLSAALGAEFSGSSRFHMGITQASFSLGAVVSPFICEALITAGYQYNAMFGMLSAVYLALFIVFLFTVQKNDIKGNGGFGIRSAARFFSQRAFTFAAAGMILYVGAECTISYFTDSYFELTLGRPEISALALSLFWAGMIPTRMLLGAIRLKHNTAIIGCSAGILASIVALLLIQNDTARLVAYFALGLSCGPCWPLIMDMVIISHQRSAGTVSNIMISAGGFGGAIVPVIAGLFISGADFTPIFIIAAAGMAAMSAMLYLGGRQTYNSS